MGKTWIYVFLLLLVSKASIGQSLRIITGSNQHTGQIGTTLTTPIKIQNNSDHLMVIGYAVAEQNLRSSQSATFCINNDCKTKGIAQATRLVKLMPGEIFEGFSTQLETGLVPGNSTLKLVFFNMINPAEKVETELTYTIAEKRKENILFQSDVLELSDVYPNPVHDQAIFKYNFFNPLKKAKIVLLSVLGSVVHEIELSPYETSASINVEDLNPGVYFYTLYIDNEGVATKKMVVRK